MGGNYPGLHGRRRAIAMQAADAKANIQAALPAVARILTRSQLDQVQKVLDAAVVNPWVQDEHAALMRMSVTLQVGDQVNRDPEIVRRADKVAEELIDAGEADKRIQIDFKQLLTANALTPVTDNPDEAVYLSAMRNTLTSKGVWLRFDNRMVRDPDDASRWVIDPRSFQAWLSLGPDGGTIPTADGTLTRDALLGNTLLGANYYRNVTQGTIQTALDRAIKRLRNAISDGETQHEMEQDARNQAKLGVVTVSDTLGGAKFPSMAIWTPPNDLVVKALTQNVGGNVRESCRTILNAAMLTQHAATLLNTYENDTINGAMRAVKVLAVLTIAGKIAETVLAIQMLVGGLIRLLAREAAAETVVRTASSSGSGGAPPPLRSPEAFYRTNYAGRAATEETINASGITLDTESGVALDRYDMAMQQRIKSWNDYVLGEMKKRSASTGGSFEGRMGDYVKIVDEANAKFGDPWEFLP